MLGWTQGVCLCVSVSLSVSLCVYVCVGVGGRALMLLAILKFQVLTKLFKISFPTFAGNDFRERAFPFDFLSSHRFYWDVVCLFWSCFFGNTSWRFANFPVFFVFPTSSKHFWGFRCFPTVLWCYANFFPKEDLLVLLLNTITECSSACSVHKTSSAQNVRSKPEFPKVILFYFSRLE